MVTVYRTFDPFLIKYLYGQEGMYDMVVDDNEPTYSQMTPNMSPADMVWLVAMVGTEIAGFMRADRVNNSTYSVHVMFFKKFRGAVAREAGKLAKDFMRQMCNCTCLVAIMPCNLPYVKQFCDDNEFKIVGQLTQSYKKNGRYYDQFIMEAH